MTYHGTVQNGLVVLEDGATLPDGTMVTVVPVSQATRETEGDGAQPGSDVDSEPTIGQKLAALARKFESLPCDLPDDLAVNHDHYLHGLPKRQ